MFRKFSGEGKWGKMSDEFSRWNSPFSISVEFLIDFLVHLSGLIMC